MGWFNRKEEQAQPKSEALIADQPAKKSEWVGTFSDRYQACPDCDGVLLCDLHMAEMKARFDNTAPPASKLRRR